MRSLKKARHSKIDVFVKFESAINLEIRGQIKKKLDSFYLGHRDHMYAFSSKSGSEPFRALGDLTWNDPDAKFRFAIYPQRIRQFHDNCKIAKCQTVATLAPV